MGYDAETHIIFLPISSEIGNSTTAYTINTNEFFFYFENGKCDCNARYYRCNFIFANFHMFKIH